MSRNQALTYDEMNTRIAELEALVAALRANEVDAVITETDVAILHSDRAIEEALRESREQFRVIYDKSPIAIALYNADGALLHVNKRCLDLFGVPDIRDILTFDILSKRGMAKGIFDDIRAGKSVNYRSVFDFAEAAAHGLTNSRREGIIHTEVYVTPMARTAGKPVSGYLVQIRDVTALVRAEEEQEALRVQLLQAQKMEAVGLLAGGMAHDFNNMLTVILNSAQLAMRETEPGSSLRELLDKIVHAADRSKTITTKLLTYARKDKLNVGPTAVGDIVRNVVTMLDVSLLKKIDVVVKDGEYGAVSVDANQIEQALLNICGNARDAMPEGGTLTIETKAAAPKTMGPGEGATDWRMISIRDTGTGMTEEMLERIFDPFFTTKEAAKGTGLGLSITQGIVKSHGGHIEVESRPGEGTEFRVYLPAAAESDGAEPTLHLTRTATGTVLVVDDEPLVLELAGMVLKEAGFRVHLVGEGKSAVELYRERGNEIDLVVLDLIMPGMDGAKVFQAIREMNPKARVVLVSGYGVNGATSELMAGGMAAFIQKPYSPNELCDVVGEVM